MMGPSPRSALSALGALGALGAPLRPSPLRALRLSTQSLGLPPMTSTQSRAHRSRTSPRALVQLDLFLDVSILITINE